MNLTRLTPLDGEAILPLVEARAHLRIFNEAENDVIAALRDAAVSYVERMAGMPLVPTGYRWTLPRFSTRIDLPVRPVISLGAVVYHNSDGVEVEYDGARLVGGSMQAAADGSWPTAYGYVAVEFTAGLGSPSEAPELVTAAKLQLEVLNDRGRSAPDVIRAREKAVDALIGSYRAVLV